MASEATIKQKLLDDELAKAYPDPDIVYHLQVTRDYWNTVDNDRNRSGADKVDKLMGANSLQSILTKILVKR